LRAAQVADAHAVAVLSLSVTTAYACLASATSNAGPGRFGLGVRQRREVLPDHRGTACAVDVADHDHRHEIRTVPVAVEATS
jgi:hypothetical protein